MRIGVNAVPLSIKMGGLRQYFHRLFRELLSTDFNNTYVFFYSSENESELELLGNNRWREGAIKVHDQGEILLHIMKVDVYFCPFAVLWPRPLPIPSVVQLADIQEAYYPQFFTEDVLRSRRLHYASSTRGADAVITLSEYSKQTIAKHHLIDPDKIFVAHLAAGDSIDSLFNPSDLAHLYLPEKFIIYPANHWHHKNHDMLLRALSYIKREHGVEIPCICTGFPMEDGYPLLERIVEFELSEQVLHVGYVSDEELRVLYSRATLLCFPSLFEGFGMPILEAMSAGCPVVCSNVTSLPEIVDAAAVMFDPKDYRDMASALLKVWNDDNLRNELRDKGKNRARQFTVARMATVHLEAFEHAVNVFLPESRNVYKQYVYSVLGDSVFQGVVSINNRLKAMESSLSWRITKPLRWVGDKLRGM